MGGGDGLVVADSDQPQLRGAAATVVVSMRTRGREGEEETTATRNCCSNITAHIRPLAD